MTSRYPDVPVGVFGASAEGILSVPHEIAHRLGWSKGDMVSPARIDDVEKQLPSLIVARGVRNWALDRARQGILPLMTDCPECAGTGNSATARTGLCSICVDPYQGNKGRPHDMAG